VVRATAHPRLDWEPDHTVGSQIHTRDSDEACARLAGLQFGVISREQALSVGMTERMITQRISSSRWDVVLPCVYRICGAPISQLQQLMAAQLYMGPPSVVFGRCAAGVWGIEGGRLNPPEIASPRQVKAGGVKFIARRCTSIEPCDVTRLDNLPVTNRVRTLIDLSAAVDVRTLESALDQLLREHPGSLQRLTERLEELRAKRLRGVKRLRRLVEERDPVGAITESALEASVLRWLGRNGFPEPVAQHWVDLPNFGPVRLDFAYPDKLIGVEADSYAWHSGREAFERDRARISELASLGWTIIQTTHREMKRHPGRVAARLNMAFSLRVGI
jgi:hypothetical protein